MSATTTPMALIGVDPATMQQWLRCADGLCAVMTGGRSAQVSFGAGDGGAQSGRLQSRQRPQLPMWIQQLQQTLGLSRGRRAISVRFVR